MTNIKWDGKQMMKWKLMLKLIRLQLLMIAPLPISSTRPPPYSSTGVLIKEGEGKGIKVVPNVQGKAYKR